MKESLANFEGNHEEYSTIDVYSTPIDSPQDIKEAYTRDEKLRFSLKIRDGKNILTIWILTSNPNTDHGKVDPEGFIKGMSGYISKKEGVSYYIGENSPKGIEDIFSEDVIEEKFFKFLGSI